jgi:CPA2 family monovalent cation:H+ antiporter-2
VESAAVAVDLVREFSWLLVVAAGSAIAARLLHFPLLLAYIIGGIALNFSVNGTSIIQAQGTIRQISELGVIFLMFYMGLEFDLRKLRQLFGPVIIALVFQTLFMIFLGRAIAPFLGWGGLNGLFLGGLLAISSTMIAVPVLAEQGALQKNFARLAMGLLIFEDILAVLLLVVLSGIAITGYFDWDAVGRITFFVGAFVLTIFFLGRLSMPLFIRMVKKFRSEEFFTVVVVGVLLAVGLLAEAAHFSTALGAFLAGAIFCNTEIAEIVEETMRPIRTLFTAIFFLSTGLSVDLSQLAAYAGPILLLTFLVFVVKVLACFLGFFLSGQSGEDSFRAPMATAQIGEFSFVIASLGTSLGVTNNSLLSLAIGVSLGTAFCTALLSPRAGAIFRFLIRFWPKSLLKFGRIYRETLTTIGLRFSQNKSLNFALRPLVYIVVNALLFFSLLTLASYAIRFVDRVALMDYLDWHMSLAIWAIAALLSLPLITTIVRQVNVLFVGLIENSLLSIREKSKTFLLGRLSGVFQTAIFSFLLLLLGGIFLSVAAPTLPRGVPLYVFLMLLLLAGFLFRRRMLQVNNRLEGYFMATFSRDIHSQLASQRETVLKKLSAQSIEDLDMLEVPLSEEHCGCYVSIRDLSLRERFGVSIIALRHRSHLLFSPPADCLLVPGTSLILIGNREDLDRVRGYFATPAVTSEEIREGLEAVEIACLPLHTRHGLVGKTLEESQLRKKFRVNVVKILRKEGPVPMPPPCEVFRNDDVLVLAGEGSAIRRTQEQFDCLSVAEV